MNAFWEKAAELGRSATPFVVVTLVSSRGSTPADPGAKAIITLDGIQLGTVGGGKVEARAILHAQELLTTQNSPPQLITWNLQTDIKMTCGGEVTYLFEVHRSDTWKIAVFGAGHVAQALIRALEPIDCQVTCIDSRAEWIERLPSSTKLKKIVESNPASLVDAMSPDTYFVVMTQGHATDVPILDAILKRHPDLAYAGSIGSDVKALKVKADLKSRGISDAAIARLRCPIGLELGSNHPAEIAISVIAELLQTRDRSRGPKQQSGARHDP